MRDFLYYVAIGLGILAITLWLAIYEPRVSLGEFRTWFAFIFFTVLLAVFLVRMYWRERRRAKLLVLLSVFLAAHVAAYLAILHYPPEWPTLWYIPGGTAEVMLFIVLANPWLDVLPSGTKM